MAERLGRVPGGGYAIVVRHVQGAPVVISNEPSARDGTPMPTRLLAGRSRPPGPLWGLKAAGGVRDAEASVDPETLAETHRRYAAQRDALIPPGWSGPRPSGGVGGTRRGVKRRDVHLAWWLAGGDDPVGAWVAGRLGLDRAEVVGEPARRRARRAGRRAGLRNELHPPARGRRRRRCPCPLDAHHAAGPRS